jgi:fructosamine-3-kinase
MTALAEAGAALLGGTVARVEVLSGGDLSQIVRIVLADGRQAVIKSGPAPRTEAAMLRAIADAGAPAPAVLAANDEALALEVMPTDGSLEGAWASLGSAVAALHRATGVHYGWPEDYAFGAVLIANRWAEDWPAFWAERRLLTNLPYLPAGIGRRLERLAAALPDRLPARPPAALLHGDLWVGNVLVAGDRVTALVDPACYYGHSEVDLAMLGLFGHPGEAFRNAYGALASDADQRRPIYQLWPALAHLRLFGGGYLSLVERLLSAAGA